VLSRQPSGGSGESSALASAAMPKLRVLSSPWGRHCGFPPYSGVPRVNPSHSLDSTMTKRCIVTLFRMLLWSSGFRWLQLCKDKLPLSVFLVINDNSYELIFSLSFL
jgi:hypothetical protein